MSTPTTSNTAANIINDVISALMSGGEQAAEAYLTALDPAILSVPIIAWLMDEGVQWLGQILSIAAQKFADNVIIDIQTNAENSEVINASTALALAIGSGDQSAIQNAVSNASAAYKAAFGFDGWATPK